MSQPATDSNAPAIRAGRKTSRRAPRAPTLDDPVVIARFWKNRAHDIIAVSLTSYEGHNLIDVRTFVTNSSGKSVPTPKGISISVRRLPELAAALNVAVAQARLLGILDDEAGT